MAVDKFKQMMDQEMLDQQMPRNVARHLTENYSGECVYRALNTVNVKLKTYQSI